MNKKHFTEFKKHTKDYLDRHSRVYKGKNHEDFLIHLAKRPLLLENILRKMDISQKNSAIKGLIYFWMEKGIKVPKHYKHILKSSIETKNTEKLKGINPPKKPYSKPTVTSKKRYNKPTITSKLNPDFKPKKEITGERVSHTRAQVVRQILRAPKPVEKKQDNTNTRPTQGRKIDRRANKLKGHFEYADKISRVISLINEISSENTKVKFDFDRVNSDIIGSKLGKETLKKYLNRIINSDEEFIVRNLIHKGADVFKISEMIESLRTYKKGKTFENLETFRKSLIETLKSKTKVDKGDIKRNIATAENIGLIKAEKRDDPKREEKKIERKPKTNINSENEILQDVENIIFSYLPKPQNENEKEIYTLIKNPKRLIFGDTKLAGELIVDIIKLDNYANTPVLIGSNASRNKEDIIRELISSKYKELFQPLEKMSEYNSEFENIISVDGANIKLIKDLMERYPKNPLLNIIYAKNIRSSLLSESEREEALRRGKENSSDPLVRFYFDVSIGKINIQRKKEKIREFLEKYDAEIRSNEDLRNRIEKKLNELSSKYSEGLSYLYKEALKNR